MSEDCLKLTTYFGERDRHGSRLLADELLDLYARRGVRAGVLVRGIEGFGAKHHMRSDRLLTLSEDLPVVSVAVDVRSRIEAMLDEVMEIKRRGLVTLERARMVAGGVQGLDLSPELAEATKLTVYVGRGERIGRSPAFVALCELLHRRGLAGATVLLGVDGLLHGRRARARFFSGNPEVPLMIISVGPSEQIAAAVPEVTALLSEPLITLERVRICKRDGQLIAPPHELPGIDEHGLALWQKLMVHTSESARVGGRSLHSELVHRLRLTGAAGATSVRGIWGFHGDHRPHGDRLLQIHRNVPVVTIVIDRPERMAAAFAEVDALTGERGLVTSEMVPAAATLLPEGRRGGVRLARHRF
jgi:PII-like signaling protein